MLAPLSRDKNRRTASASVAARPRRSHNRATSLPSAACLPTLEADSLPDRKTMPHRAHQRRLLVSMNLYVGGLSFDTTDDGLKTFFEQAGTVESASVITDRDSGRSPRVRLRRDDDGGRRPQGDRGSQRQDAGRPHANGERGATADRKRRTILLERAAARSPSRHRPRRPRRDR